MHFSSINFLGVLAAGIVGFVVNFGWFGPLKMYDRWNKALGRTEPLKPEDMSPAPQLFGLTLLSVFVEAATIALVLFAAYDSPSLGQGLCIGATLGIGIAAMASLGHRMFSAQGLKVWAIEVGADIVVASVIGVIIAAIG